MSENQYTKVITLINHSKSKQPDELITIPSNYLQIGQSVEKSSVQDAIGFGFGFATYRPLS